MAAQDQALLGWQNTTESEAALELFQDISGYIRRDRRQVPTVLAQYSYLLGLVDWNTGQSWIKNERLLDFKRKLESACVESLETVESGKMTEDLALLILSMAPNRATREFYLNTKEFKGKIQMPYAV